MKIEVEIDPTKYGLLLKHEDVSKAFSLLTEVYRSLWREGGFDPSNETLHRYAKPLYKKMSAANEILGFKK